MLSIIMFIVLIFIVNSYSDTISYFSDINSDSTIDSILIKTIKYKDVLEKEICIKNGRTKEEYFVSYYFNGRNIISISPLHDKLFLSENESFLKEICDALCFDYLGRKYQIMTKADPSLDWILKNGDLNTNETKHFIKLKFTDSISHDMRSYYLITDLNKIKIDKKSFETYIELNSRKFIEKYRTNNFQKVIIFYDKSYMCDYTKEYKSKYIIDYQFKKPELLKVNDQLSVFKTKNSLYVKYNEKYCWIFISNMVTMLRSTYICDVTIEKNKISFIQMTSDWSRTYEVDLNKSILKILKTENQ